MLILALVFYGVVVPALSIAAIVVAVRARRRLEAAVAALGKRLDTLDLKSAPPPPPARETAPPLVAEPVAIPAVPAEEPAQPAAATPGRLRESFEQQLTSRWLVWLGAVTVALGGTFLVKYAIDYGWLGPAARVALGVILGLALVIAGEVLRRRPLQRAISAVRADYVPPSLTAAGLFIAFASVYAAMALYELISPAVAFAVLAILALAGVILSLLLGPFIALLGLLGGFMTPLLVNPQQEPSPSALFGFLALLIAAVLATCRSSGRLMLAWPALAGAVIWPLIWLSETSRRADILPVGLFLLVVAVLFLALARIPAQAVATLPGSGGAGGLRLRAAEVFRPLLGADGVACVLLALVALAVADAGTFGGIAVAVLLAFAGLYLIVGRSNADRAALAVVAALLLLAVAAIWPLPAVVAGRPPWLIFQGTVYGSATGRLIPAEVADFVRAVSAFAVLTGIGGFVALPGAVRPALWAAISAATPILLLALAYWRLADLHVDPGWTVIALTVAGLAVAAVVRLARVHPPADAAPMLAAYAAAAIAALSLGATMALREAWLTVALALQLPALAWIEARLPIAGLRSLAMAVAGIVIVRLLFNPYIVDYPVEGGLSASWVLYGYGLPAIAFFAAAFGFRRRGDDILVALLDGGGIAFLALLVMLQIHLAVTGPLGMPPEGLLGPSLQSIAWLAAAIALTRPGAWFDRPVVRWARRILAFAAVALAVTVQGVQLNPLLTGEAVGDMPVLNLLLPAYAVPAVLAVVYGGREPDQPVLAQGCRIAALALMLMFVTLGVRHLFHGGVLAAGTTTDAEWYAYSAAWLAFALLLLAWGVRSGAAGLRWASLVIVLATVGKVFVSDMDALTGLYRVASFLGLGLSLVGIGFVYQRYIFPPRPPEGGA